MIKHPLDAAVDTVSVFDDVALSADELNALGTDMPCAAKFSGDGYAYFPGNTAAHGWGFTDRYPPDPGTLVFWIFSKCVNRFLVEP